MDLLTSIGLEETHTPLHVIFIRLLIASGLGAVIGFERGSKAGPAGLRTHILIALAAALFTTLAFEIFHLAMEHGSQNLDPIRAIEAVTAGIAFLIATVYFFMKVLGFPFPLGNPTTVILILFIGGIQLIGIGVLGEYIARIYDEVRERPKFIVERAEGFDIGTGQPRIIEPPERIQHADNKVAEGTAAALG